MVLLTGREGNIATKYLLSVYILLTDFVVALRLSAKCNVARFRVRNGLVCCVRIKYEKSYWIWIATRGIITHLPIRRTKRRDAHLRDGVQVHSL